MHKITSPNGQHSIVFSEDGYAELHADGVPLCVFGIYRESADCDEVWEDEDKENEEEPDEDSDDLPPAGFSPGGKWAWVFAQGKMWSVELASLNAHSRQICPDPTRVQHELVFVSDTHFVTYESGGWFRYPLGEGEGQCRWLPVYSVECWSGNMEWIACWKDGSKTQLEVLNIVSGKVRRARLDAGDDKYVTYVSDDGMTAAVEHGDGSCSSETLVA